MPIFALLLLLYSPLAQAGTLSGYKTKGITGGVVVTVDSGVETPCDADPQTELPPCEGLLGGVQVQPDEPAPISEPGDRFALTITMGRDGKLDVVVHSKTAARGRQTLELREMDATELSSWIQDRYVVDEASGTLLMRTQIEIASEAARGITLPEAVLEGIRDELRAPMPSGLERVPEVER